MPESAGHYLGQILELSERLLQSDLSPSQRDLATSLYAASAALRACQLDRQRLTEEPPNVSPIEFDLQTLVHGLRDQFSSRRVLQCDIDPSLATRRSGDPETLRMALRLQLVPGLTHPGPPIELKLQAGSEEGRVRFEIRGQRLREELGPKTLVERLGGSFSQSDTGTAFELPLAICAPQVAGEVQTRPLAGSRVLLVSSEFDKLQTIFRHTGIEVAGEWKPDLNPQAILLNEAECSCASAARVEEWRKRCPDCPILILLDVARRGDCEFYRNLGCQGFLVRPLDRSQLLEILGSLLAIPSGNFLTAHQMRETSTAGARVLVVEDNPTARMLTLKLVKRAGHVAIEADSGEQALRLAAQELPNVILLDLSLGDMNGLEVARRLRALGSATASIPIIAATAHSGEEIRAGILAAGIDDYLSKPFRFEELSRKLAQWTGKQILVGPPAQGVGSLPPAIDQEALERAGMGDPAFQAELVESFLLECNQILQQIAGCPAEEARHLAHSLKGTASMLGAFQLSDLASRLELEGEPQKSPLIAQVEVEFRRAEKELAVRRA